MFIVLYIFIVSVDTTLVNYGESEPTTIHNELVEPFTEANLVETVHRADELGNIYTDNSSNYISSQQDPLSDINDQYDSYINDYTFDSKPTSCLIRQTEGKVLQDLSSNNVEINIDSDNLFLSQADSLLAGESQDETFELPTTMTAEEMLISERERERKSKKELEEEEREKMQ